MNRLTNPSTEDVEKLKELSRIIEEPKQTRTAELIAESKVLGILVTHFKVPSNLLKMRSVTKTDDLSDTDFFSIVLPNGETEDATAQVISRVAEKVAKALSWTSFTFRGRKNPVDVIKKKLLTIQKTVDYEKKSKLADLCMKLERCCDELRNITDDQVRIFQNVKFFNDELEKTNNLIEKRVSLIESFEITVDNPDALESIREYMGAKLPLLLQERTQMYKKVEFIKEQKAILDNEFTANNIRIFNLRETILDIINHKPVSLWPKKRE